MISTEATPDHSSLSIIRQRLGLVPRLRAGLHPWFLSALSEHGLLRGKNLGIDSSVLEANASLRGVSQPEHRGSLLGLCQTVGWREWN